MARPGTLMLRVCTGASGHCEQIVRERAGRPCAPEAQLLSKLRHPNIIAYKESFLTDADRTLCIVTAFAEARRRPKCLLTLSLYPSSILSTMYLPSCRTPTRPFPVHSHRGQAR